MKCYANIFRGPQGTLTLLFVIQILFSSSTSVGSGFMPIDTDGDGIPDYVEDANGNGVVDANETDWRTQYTTPGVWDLTNSIYDDVDLDGDGLTGWQEKILGTNPLLSDNPMDFSHINLPGPLSGVVTIPININTNTDTNTLILLTVNGAAVDTSVYQSNGVWFASWDTTSTANGVYQLNFEMVESDGEVVIPVGTTFVNVQNGVCFPDDVPLFGNALYVHAQTISINGTWTMDVYDDQDNLFTSLSGPVDANGYCDYPDTSQEGVAISLPNNNQSTYYDVYVTTYPAATAMFNSASANDANSGGTSSISRRYYPQKNVGDGKNWVIAYMQVFGQPSGNGEDPPAQLGSMMEGAAQIIVNSQYGINNASVVNQITTTAGLPYTFTLDQSRDWTTLLNLLEFSEAENFVYFGHAGPNLIGLSQPYGLSSDLLKRVLVLQNHPYRFVFLYGCQSAEGNLPDAFGITKKKWKNNKAGLTPQAFLGWDDKRSWFYKHFLPPENQYFFEGFWREWSGTHPNLQDAINYAYRVRNYDYFASEPTEPCPDAKEIVLYGDPALTFYH